MLTAVTPFRAEHQSQDIIDTDNTRISTPNAYKRPSEDDFAAEDHHQFKRANYSINLEEQQNGMMNTHTPINFPGMGGPAGAPMMPAPGAMPAGLGGAPLFPGGGPPPGGGDFAGPPIMADGSLLIEQVEIPNDCVGLVIGQKGTQINQIQDASGCKVQMNDRSQAPPNAPRIATLQGSRESIEKAKQMIMDVINQAGGRPPPAMGGMGGLGGMPGGGGGGGGFRGQDGPLQQIEMLIPPDRCGLVIGKGGETIKSIMEKSGAKLHLIQDQPTPTGEPKPLRITGTADKIALAERMVNEAISDDRPGGVGGPRRAGLNGSSGGAGMFQGQPMMPQQANSIGEVIVPRASVGMIIGKGGENIKRMASETGAKIQFKEQEAEAAPERTAIIRGTPLQIQAATQLISDLVSKVMADKAGEPNECLMPVLASKTGLVIGKGGEVIRGIISESGCHVELKRDGPQNANEKLFVLKGTPQQIQHAQHLIRQKVGDIPQNVPFGGAPGQGPMGGQQMMQQAPVWGQPLGVPMAAPGPFQAFQQQQPGQAAIGPWGLGPAQLAPQQAIDTGTAAWGAPQQPQLAAVQTFAPQQQQQQQMMGGGVQASMVQQAGGGAGGMQQPQQQTQQQQTAAPTINPITGQPDYSQAWIEYYRAQGMHQEAEQVIAQVKQQAAIAVGGQQQPQPVNVSTPQQQTFQQFGGGAPAQLNTSGAGGFGGNYQQQF